MNAKMVACLVVLFCMPGAQAFAQFKNAAQSAKNIANLERVVTRATHKAVVGRPIVTNLPQGLVRGSAVALSRVEAPKVITSVTKSYATLLSDRRAGSLDNERNKEVTQSLANEWAANSKRVFYEDQTQLAHDLNEFYKGKADMLIGPDGHTVKLYALAANGILYKPVGYQVPLVLNADEYFVVYDVKAKTGQIVQNKPEIYGMYRPASVEEEIWQAAGWDKVFDDINNLGDTVLMTHLHKLRLTWHSPVDSAAQIREMVRKNNAYVFQAVRNPSDLIHFLQNFPQVQLVQGKMKAYVIDLPVDGLTWVKPDGSKHVYNKKEHALLVFEYGFVNVVLRADLENPALFKKLK